MRRPGYLKVYWARRRAEAKEAGVCWKCLERTPDPTSDGGMCQLCRLMPAIMRRRGVCPQCMKREAAPGRIMCEACARYQREYYGARRLEERGPLPPKVHSESWLKRKGKGQYALRPGVCPRCRHRPSAENRRLCEGCLEYVREYWRRRRERRKGGGDEV